MAKFWLIQKSLNFGVLAIAEMKNNTCELLLGSDSNTGKNALLSVFMIITGTHDCP